VTLLWHNAVVVKFIEAAPNREVVVEVRGRFFRAPPFAVKRHELSRPQCTRVIDVVESARRSADRRAS